MREPIARSVPQADLRRQQHHQQADRVISRARSTSAGSRRSSQVAFKGMWLLPFRLRRRAEPLQRVHRECIRWVNRQRSAVVADRSHPGTHHRGDDFAVVGPRRVACLVVDIGHVPDVGAMPRPLASTTAASAGWPGWPQSIATRTRSAVVRGTSIPNCRSDDSAPLSLFQWSAVLGAGAPGAGAGPPPPHFCVAVRASAPSRAARDNG